jgi:hypothetical protein
MATGMVATNWPLSQPVRPNHAGIHRPRSNTARRREEVSSRPGRSGGVDATVGATNRLHWQPFHRNHRRIDEQVGSEGAVSSEVP